MMQQDETFIKVAPSLLPAELHTVHYTLELHFRGYMQFNSDFPDVDRKWLFLLK